MRYSFFHHLFLPCTMIVMILCLSQTAFAQTTTFTYQGKLSDGGPPANGQYDFQFKLFDTATVGTGSQQGSTVTVSNVTVTAGIFTVQIDFGACATCFNGAPRFLEIAVKPTSGSTFTTLGPRQPLSSTPYSIRSLNAAVADGLSVACVNCVTSSQIQTVQGSQVTGNIAGSQISGLIPVASVPAGSGNYIQNTTSPQAASNFNISGNGTAAGTLSGNVLNATTQYNLNNQRVLFADGLKIFVGIGAGSANTTGSSNAFFGSAGQFNTTGSGNSFFGMGAGSANMTGSNNSFFGAEAGENNSIGQRNSYFGAAAGINNTGASDNSFFGYHTGLINAAPSNSFFGSGAGQSNTTGGRNSFFGVSAGMMNSGGGDNSFFGWTAGLNNTTGQENAFFGWSAGISNTTGSRNTFIGVDTGFNADNPTGDDNTLVGAAARVNSGVSNSTAIGAGALATASNTVVLGTDQEVVDVPGKLQIDTLGTAGSQQLCLNGSNRVAPCSSSLRYKTNLRPFAGGLEIINRLQPISFAWKVGGRRDVGLAAEEVAKVEPLLTFTNAQGEIEGVKYNQLSALFINAFKQQQAQIERQQLQIKRQQSRINALEEINAENAELKAQIADIGARLKQLEKPRAARKQRRKAFSQKRELLKPKIQEQR